MSIRTRTSGIMVDINVEPTTGGAYAGPGDIVSSALGWWGFRAYSASAIGTNCVKLRFNDATLIVYQTVAGGGLPLSTITADGVTHGTPITVDTLYDQSGNGLDQVQSTAGLQPTFTFNAVGSLPGMTCSRAVGERLLSAGTITQSQPLTISWIAKRTASFTSAHTIIFDAAGGEQIQTGLGDVVTGSNTILMYAGSVIAGAAATDGDFHAVQAIFNGASSEAFVDGVSTAQSPGANNFSGSPGIVTPDNSLTGIVLEGGIWAGAFSVGNKSNMNSNQHTYWGF